MTTTPGPGMLVPLLKRDRLIVSAAVAIIALASWCWLLAGAGMGTDGVALTRMYGAAGGGMDMMLPGTWSAGYILLMLGMWWVMMIAMMLPAAAPVMLMATAINRRADPGNPPYGNVAWFLAGYLAGWAGFSLFAVLLQYWLARGEFLSGMLLLRPRLLAGGVLLLAGLWQFTPLKQVCLKHCRSPVEFLTTRRRAGNRGALLMGLEHGAWCLGCCWFLMLLLFVGGVMNLYWIAGLALYVWLEKVHRFGAAGSRIAGLLLLLWGGIVIGGA